MPSLWIDRKRLVSRRLLSGFLIVSAIAFAALPGCKQKRIEPADPGTYLFCFWNVQDFYDDEDNPKETDDVENAFGRNPDAFHQKTARLAEALLAMNDERGPDIIAMVEVESDRALATLQTELNQRLVQTNKSDLAYVNRAFIPDNTGRRIAPALLTRLPITRDRTQKLGKGGLARILEVHITPNTSDLAVIIAHWTSRVSDKDGTNRARYADTCYGRFRAITEANPHADIILCGDFNDDFKDQSIQHHLRAVDSAEACLTAGEPRPFDLCARFDLRKEGTISYQRKWNVFDHILISRGMLDERGWSCRADSITIVRPERGTSRAGIPEKFRIEDEPERRGVSDHFPVTVRIRLHGT